MVEFTQDIVGSTSGLILAGFFLLYAMETAWFTERAFRLGLEDRWSSASAMVLMAALAGLFLANGHTVIPSPFGPFLVLVAIASLINSYVFTLGRAQDRIDAFVAQFGARMDTILQDLLPEERLAAFQKMREQFRPDFEMRRKSSHIAMGLFLVYYLVLGYLLFNGLTHIIPEGVVLDNLQAAVDAGWLASGHVFSMTLLLGLLLILAPNEMVRLRFPELSYPFKALIAPSLRKREAGLFGAHYHILVGLGVGSLWLTRDPSRWSETIPYVLAMFSVTIFADAASALVGKRWGKTKWFHNTDKSYLGTVGGALVAVAATIPFVSLPWALGAAGAFIAMDILGPKPVSVTDNILNPFALALLFSFA